MQQEPTGFFDKNTIIAILLSFAVFFGWQFYMQKKYPKAYTTEVKQEESQQTLETKTDSPAAVPVPENTAAVEAKTDPSRPVLNPAVEAQELMLEYPTFDMKISSLGMTIHDLKINSYHRRNGDDIIYKDPVQQFILSTPAQFQLQKTDNETIVGQLADGDRVMNVTYKIVPDVYLIKVKATISQKEKSLLKINARSINQIVDMPTSFLLPPTDHQEFFVEAAGKIQREKVRLDTVYNQEIIQTQVAGFNSQYFANVFLNRAELLPTFTGKVENKKAFVDWSYSTAQPAEQLSVEYEVYVGPKKEEILQRVDAVLSHTIDYGIFGFIGRPMHTALLYIFKVVGNWGLAIIVITLLLRTLILPAGVYSFRSMKKMQKIQPRLQAIKEKYKGDPQRANQETLQLMRAEKANPLSGCLPALLQLPIFIAFFSMMSSSFELYMQPFYLWIHDLSSKDPFYVFPILAGGTMYFQMKMSPTTTTDPAQQKIMQFMPLLFSVFMLSTPSGLALYMFVGSLFSIFQQLMFMKEKTT